MNTKRFEIEMSGHEDVRHLRSLTIEVPDDATEDEINMIKSTVFEGIPEHPAWQAEESYGISACEDVTVEVTGEVEPSRAVDCRIERGQSGDLVLVTKDE